MNCVRKICPSLIEPLEQRIAPALLVAGANLLGGSGNPKTGEASIGGDSLTLVKVLSGVALVWYDGNAITSISVGPKTSLDITGDVGSIIGNLTAAGQLSDSDNNATNGLDGNLLLPNDILGITTHPLSNGEQGSIGNIVTGGSVSNLNIAGAIHGIYAGDGAFYTGGGIQALSSHVLNGNSVAFDVGVDTNPTLPNIQSTFVFPSSEAKSSASIESGASIKNVHVGAAAELQIFAGNGASGGATKPGSPGGSISGVTIDSAYVDQNIIFANGQPPSYAIVAGAGGPGTSGGAGGSISSVIEHSAAGAVYILGGAGGIGGKGSGGVGGSIKALDLQSASAAYTVTAGKGGRGTPGGAGGSVTGVNFSGNSPSNGIIVTAPFTGGSADDVLLIDSGTGNMVIEHNNGNGSGFNPITQGFVTGDIIAGLGTTPVSAVAVDVNHDGLPDIVVAYKNSNNIVAYVNLGGGVFVQESSSGGSISDTPNGFSLGVPFSPTKIVAGDFAGDSNIDIAVLASTATRSTLTTAVGNGTGSFVLQGNPITLPGGATDLVAANIQNHSTSDLVVGFTSGVLDALLSNGAASGAPFNIASTGVVVAGGVANFDYNPQNHQILALNQIGTEVTIYSSAATGLLTQVASLPLAQQPGNALVAHYIGDPVNASEPIEVLSSVASGARVDLWTFDPATSAYGISATIHSSEPLRNFVPVSDSAGFGVAAVGGSLGHFAFSQSSSPFYDVGLPFNGKKVGITAGSGGNGVDQGTHAGNGGAGGSVIGMNVVAGDISVTAGDGGSAVNGAGGVGGSVRNTPLLVTATGTLQTILQADTTLLIQAGAGGTSSGAVHSAAGGAGGSSSALNLSISGGNIQVASGNGGAGGGGAGGNAGSVFGIVAADAAGDITVTAGKGGSALGATGNGGSGGSINNITYSLALADPTVEKGYNVNFLGGGGGASLDAIGGAGGSVSLLNLTLQPSNETYNDNFAQPPLAHANVDSTVRINVTAGNGGAGAKGGAGGSLKTINSTSVFDQIITIVTPTGTLNFDEINPVAAHLVAGNGGDGTKTDGGLGGSVTALNLKGISFYDFDQLDPQAGGIPLVVVSGNGGNGAGNGGAAGSISGVVAANALFGGTSQVGRLLNATELAGASILSGHGGNGATGSGGAGGIISKINAGVSGWDLNGALSVLTTTGTLVSSGGDLNVIAGAGGSGGASGKGGTGGSVLNSTLGTVNSFDQYGLWLQAGNGGAGGLGGGLGGSVSGAQLNTPQNPNSLAANYDVLTTLIVAGNGGAASGAGATGGAGGSVTHILQTKDVNSCINVIQAGNGGASSAGTGGIGGSVLDINTVGLIGQASDDVGHTFGAFQTFVASQDFSSIWTGGIPEGIFAGRGGAGATAGQAGSVMSVTAAQIAAIGAAVDSSGHFAAAARIANITSRVVAYDVNGNGSYDNAANSTTQNPSQSTPIDGFIFSQTTPVGIKTSNNGRLAAFTFIG